MVHFVFSFWSSFCLISSPSSAQSLVLIPSVRDVPSFFELLPSLLVTPLDFLCANGQSQSLSETVPSATDSQSSMMSPHPQIFFLLCQSGSLRRQTFFPSTMTSMEYIRNSHSILI